MKLLGPEFVYSAEIHNIPLNIQEKFMSYLSDRNIGFSLVNNSFIVELSNQKEYEEILSLSNEIKKADNFIEALLLFPELNIEDLFYYSTYIPFDDLIPYLNDLESRGLIFSFNENNANDYAMDAIDFIKIISKEEYLKLITVEETVYYLWTEKANSTLAEQWLLSTGFNYLNKNISSKPQLVHVIDYLNHFENKISSLEDDYSNGRVSLAIFKNRKIGLEKKKKSAINSSFEENLIKANQWMVQEAKRLNTQEDWSGLREVFKIKSYTFYQLLSDKAKDRESGILNHCVGQGGYDDVAGIYSLRTNENIPLATIEINANFEVEQVQGSYNQEIIEKDVLEAIRLFLHDYLKIQPKTIEELSNTGWSSLSLTFIISEKDNKFISDSYEVFFPSCLAELPTDNFFKIILPPNGLWEQPLLSLLEEKKVPAAVQQVVLAQIKIMPPFLIKKEIAGIPFRQDILTFYPTFIKSKNIIHFFNKNLSYIRKEFKIKINELIKQISLCSNSIELNNLLFKITSFGINLGKSPYVYLSNATLNTIKEYNELVKNRDLNTKHYLDPFLKEILVKHNLNSPNELVSNSLLKTIFSISKNSISENIRSISAKIYDFPVNVPTVKSCPICNEFEIRKQIVAQNNKHLNLLRRLESLFAPVNNLLRNPVLKSFLDSEVFSNIYLEYTFGEKNKAIQWLEQEVNFLMYRKDLIPKDWADLVPIKETIDLLVSSLNNSDKIGERLRDCQNCFCKQDFIANDYDLIKEFKKELKTLNHELPLFFAEIKNFQKSKETSNEIVLSITKDWDQIKDKLKFN